MALYTQFQDPAQYYLQKEERRDESLRNAMAMMMQMKMQQREWARQNKLDELSERRVSAYEKSVADQTAEGQKQWQARWAAIDSMYPPGSRENMALKAGMSLDQIESNFYPESTVDTLTGWAGMTRQEWDQLSPSMKKQYFGKYYAEQNADTISAYRDATAQRARDKDIADTVLKSLDEASQRVEKDYKNYVSVGGESPAPLIQQHIERAKQEAFEFRMNVLSGMEIKPQHRARMMFFLDDRVKKDPFWFIPEDEREEARKRYNLSSKNNLGPKSGELFSITPTEDTGRESLYGVEKAVNPEAKTITKAKAVQIAKSMNLTPEQVERIPVKGGNIIILANARYFIPN